MCVLLYNRGKPYLQGQGIITTRPRRWCITAVACGYPCNASVAVAVGCANYLGIQDNRNGVAY